MLSSHQCTQKYKYIFLHFDIVIHFYYFAFFDAHFQKIPIFKEFITQFKFKCICDGRTGSVYHNPKFEIHNNNCTHFIGGITKLRNVHICLQYMIRLLSTQRTWRHSFGRAWVAAKLTNGCTCVRFCFVKKIPLMNHK